MQNDSKSPLVTHNYLQHYYFPFHNINFPNFIKKIKKIPKFQIDST